eukprot:tig00020944_g16368.t1
MRGRRRSRASGKPPFLGLGLVVVAFASTCLLSLIRAPHAVEGAMLSEAQATAYDALFADLPAPAGMSGRTYAAGACFNGSGRVSFMVVGGKLSTGSSDEVWVYGVDSAAWSLAPAPARAPWPGYGMKCAFEVGASFVYCAGGLYPSSGGENFWRISTTLASGPELLPRMPFNSSAASQRTGHCVAAFNGNIWVAAGYEALSGFRNDLVRYSISGRSWSTEISNNNTQMEARAYGGCARLGSRLFLSAGGVTGPEDLGSESSASLYPDIYVVDLAEGASRRFVLFASWYAPPGPSAPAPAAPGALLGVCYGSLFMVPRRRSSLPAETNELPVKMFAEDGTQLYSGRAGMFPNAFAAYDSLASLTEAASRDSCSIYAVGGWSYTSDSFTTTKLESSAYLIKGKSPASNNSLPQITDVRKYYHGTADFEGQGRELAAGTTYYDGGVLKFALFGGVFATSSYVRYLCKDGRSLDPGSGQWSVIPGGSENTFNSYGFRCASDGGNWVYCLQGSSFWRTLVIPLLYSKTSLLAPAATVSGGCMAFWNGSVWYAGGMVHDPVKDTATSQLLRLNSLRKLSI